MSTEPVGLVVVDHGSRRAESNAMLEEMAAMVAEVVPYPIVEPAHMELAEPSIARYVTGELRKVIFVPGRLLNLVV